MSEWGEVARACTMRGEVCEASYWRSDPRYNQWIASVALHHDLLKSRFNGTYPETSYAQFTTEADARAWCEWMFARLEGAQ